jgi:hypothetical protein
MISTIRTAALRITPTMALVAIAATLAALQTAAYAGNKNAGGAAATTTTAKTPPPSPSGPVPLPYPNAAKTSIMK